MIRCVKLYDKPDGPRLDGHQDESGRPFERPKVPDVNFRSGLVYAIGKTITFFREGIGVSRRAVTRNEGYTPYIHSYETLERYAGIINHFKDTVLTDVKRINQITKKHVETHFNNLLDKGGREKTVKVNASALIKLFNAFSRKDLITYIDENRSTWVSRAMPSCRTTPFGDPDKVIDAIRGKAYKAAALIQYETGARISDIKKVVDSAISHPSRTFISIMKSKGGRNRILDFSDRMESLNAVLVVIGSIQTHLSETNTNWSSFQREYTQEVKRAAKRAGEIYCGTHAFRANYANKRYEKDADTKDEVQVLRRITEDMGHSRVSMAKYYISAFRSS
ncbi:MAG: tyrosine-type recombinase/integrase [Deltaproteobacteria bacterium]